MTDTRYRDHNELVNKVLLFLHEHFTGRYWGNPTGAIKREDGHFQKYGLIGSTDIIGFTGQGRAVYIEIKTKNSVLSKEQKAFQTITLKNNCIHLVIREDFDINSFTGLQRRAV